MHYLTVQELVRLLDAHGQDHLAEVIRQIGRRQLAIRVDLDKLLRKPDYSKGSLPQA